MSDVWRKQPCGWYSSSPLVENIPIQVVIRAELIRREPINATPTIDATITI
jgi:hypothetical protein